jgi:hypothetical protein
MSVLVTIRVPADAGQFRRFAQENPDQMRAIGEAAKSKGAVSHRFGVGDSFVLAIDEWPSAEAFQGFFEGNPEIGEVMRNSGAQGPPEVTITEAIETADQF